jgi:ribulose kinase
VPKVWQILDEDPEIYAAADRIIEAADWIVWQMTGVEKRNLTTAGYKGIWSKEAGLPAPGLFPGARSAAGESGRGEDGGAMFTASGRRRAG